MKSLVNLIFLLLTSLTFLGCTEEKSSDSSSASNDSSKEEKSGGLLDSVSEKSKDLLSEKPPMEDASSQISEISGYSDTLNSTWNSIKDLGLSGLSKLAN